MILSALSTRRAEESVRYRAFVAEGKHQPAPWERLKGRIYLDSDAFIQKMQRKMYVWG